MKTEKSATFHRVLWSLLILVLAEALALVVAARQDPFLESKNLEAPAQPPNVVTFWPQEVITPSGEVVQVPTYSSFGPVVIYFIAVAIIVGGILFIIPVSKLTLVLRIIFSSLFAWGAFVIFALWLPPAIAAAGAVLLALGWFFIRRVWLHNLAMLAAMVAMGAVFGRLIAPWTAMLIVLAIAVYDFVAVRLGFMVWMADKLSETDNLPAFIIPHSLSEWRARLARADLHELAATGLSERRYSILGGGDIGFAVLLVCSVYFARGPESAFVVAGFSLAGLACAYWIQCSLLKGKPIPALPPIAAFCLAGVLIVSGLPRF